MKFSGTLIAVKNMTRSRRFYTELLGMQVTADFGENITLDRMLSLQTCDSWKNLIGREPGPPDDTSELYFETENFDAFVERAAQVRLDYLHLPQTEPWGQRTVRFRDPDGHIIEVGEDMKEVALRFLDSGLTVAETARRMDVPIEWVQERTGRC